MTAACLTGAFRLRESAEVRQLPNGEPVITLALAYNFGQQHSELGRQAQFVDARMYGSRTVKLAPRLLAGALVYAVVEDVHVEAYTTTAGAAGHKIVGRLGRVEVVAQPPRQPFPLTHHEAQALCRPS